MELLHLLWGTVLDRPYVMAFFACYLAFSIYLFGKRQTGIYLVLSFLVAFVCEFASTRWSFPFGMYVYIDSMRTEELWLSNIPAWDSLSFVFLSFFSWILAGSIRARSLRAPSVMESLRSSQTLILSGLLMMALDVVIDPLTLLGDRWFLGKIYYYPDGGSYFGVTFSNFAGWWFVGSLIPFLYLRIISPLSLTIREVPKRFYWGVYGVYAGVFLFNLGVTFYIQEWVLFVASTIVVVSTLGPVLLKLRGVREN
jgi:putative membrane protein